ncbi:MMPL family transporter [Clostridium sp. 'White wine YQ']|uniref:MMPL family transporter n=1 Tax=Clostridium sp. 'White wine YQ' TaxID=3027474 RepID=UPI002366BA1C|nr:MMPL family transporter [Clostridium sp. 'White wine YQ']MDD7793094.1 MMPL family transporter [Clostridium sp. 'White wine YQ']
MRKILKLRWAVLAIWLVATVLFTIYQPNLKQILNQKGQATISADSPSVVASKMLNNMGTSKGDTLLFVFNEDNKISDEGLKDIQKGIDNVRAKKDELKVTNIMDPFSTPEAKDQMISEDGTTVMVQVNYEKGTRDGETIISAFKDALKDVKVNHYITGEQAINNDYLDATNKGVDKSAIITVAFILIVLIIMFRSVVTPIVSLCAVGVAYLCSMGIIGILINGFNFPITSLTQMFVILVLFGIGTDYNILLFNRFKEELGHGLSIDDAVVATYKTAGKTIIYSGLTVFMAFASLTFVQFPIYRSANAVAIGIAVLLLELMTLTPVLMKLLAGKLFWPSHNTAGHKESKIWENITSVSVKHPAISLLIVAAIIAPVIALNSTKLSFDSLKDLSADTPSVKGFNIVADKFGRGKAMPTTVVIESKDAMDNNEALAVIDDLTMKLKKLDGVKQVSGVTQPKGDEIADFYTDKQTGTVADGFTSANDGIGQIKDGLNLIDEKLAAPDFSDVKKLADGTGSLADGIGQLADNLKLINDGIGKGASDGAAGITQGIEGFKQGIGQINQQMQMLSGGLNGVNSAYQGLQSKYSALTAQFEAMRTDINSMNTAVDNLAAKYPSDSDVVALQTKLHDITSKLNAVENDVAVNNATLSALNNQLNQMNNGLKQLADATAPNSQLIQGMNYMEEQVKQLPAQFKKGTDGQAQIIEIMYQLKAGALQAKDGQDKLYSGLTQLSSGMVQLKDGIGKSRDGLGSIHDGLDKGNDFLNQLTNTKTFYIPKEAFEKDDINKMFDAYLSKDRKIAKITVNLTSDPYSKESIAVIDQMQNLVKNDLKGTVLQDAKFGISGPTASTNDLNAIATHDITFTQIIVLACIFVLLIIVIRSFWIPVYIVGALLAAYYTAISVTAFLTSKLFSGMDGMSWNVPFFSFVVIAALGVDYSIFLMTRFKEYPEMSPKEAIVMAAKNIGGVVMSAAIILAGTFATLYPSNIHVLMELAICVVTGLLLLSLILLPVVIPALISITDKIASKTSRKSYSKHSEI